jgi:integrase
MTLARRGCFWHYDFWLAGQRYRGSTREMTKARAAQVQAMLMVRARERHSNLPPRRIPLLEEFASRFLEWAKTSRLEPATARYYEYGWDMLRRTRIRSLRLDQIRSEDADSLSLAGSSSNGNRALRTLRRMLGKAADWGLITAAPRIRLLKEYEREILIDPETESRILAAASQPLRDVVIMVLDAGLRPQDVFRIRWEHINWHKNVIFVPFGKTKNSRRYVPMSERMSGALLARLPEKGSSGWVFPSRRARGGHITTVAKAWRQVREELGLLSSVKLYCCRHTFATDALERTGNLAAVMKTLGHANTQTTMRYLHPGLEQLRRAVDERNREHQAFLAARGPHKSPHNDSEVNQAKPLNSLVGPPGFEPGTNGL